ncbi:MAG: ABC transporter substrate-binding protein, partial [Alphaproteobacteria bacterium]
FRGLVTSGVRHIVTNLPADTLLKISDLPEAKDVLLFNAGAPDDDLRNAFCRLNLFHVIPSRAMLADALGQYLIYKRWSRWFLVVGPRDAEKNWTYTHDARRTAQSEVPVFTQGVDYDVLILADERGDFGEYFAYRSWKPRPIAGTQGLTPTVWHRTHEQWGATQLQRRFKKLTGRWMEPVDYAAWLSVRAIGEAATRTQSVKYMAIRNYLFEPNFALQGFKGQKLTFRQWDRQLRQPILLAAPKALVATAPQEGFLHPKTTLDTLGYDEPESSCKIPGTKNKE